MEWNANNVTAIATCLLVVVGCGQAGLFVWQLKLMRRTLERSDAHSMRQHRAYLVVDRAFLDFPESNRPRSRIYIKNCGHSPAHDVKVWIHHWIERYPLGVELPKPDADFLMASTVIGPGGHVVMPLLHHSPIRANLLDEFGTASATMYVYGEVTYRDVFGEHHRTSYRLMHGGTNPGDGQHLRPCPEGNEAD